MRARVLAAAALLVAVAASCRDDKGGGEARAASAEPAAAAEGAMCEEHGVLEAICTKCNPKLIPVFQAKGDWCEEHGFPESVCPICHPERGGKPSADMSDDGAPADGTKVRFKTKETARLAGIETVPAELVQGKSGLNVPARVVYDATRVAALNARAPGIVRSVKADVGTMVKRGTPLAVIQSAEVSGDQSHLEAARIRVRTAEANYQREKDLYAKQISSQKDLLAAGDELERAKADLAALEASLGQIGAGGQGTYSLVAPFAGMVTRREAVVGNHVGTEETLFQIVDTSSMWAELDVPERELRSVAVGQSVVLVIDGLGERELTGTIAWVAPEIDPQTRTVKVRVPLPNPDGALRANMFGQARIMVGGDRQTVVVPRSAVQRAKGVQLVFVRLSEDEFEARRVQLGASEGDRIELKSGVRGGEQVVTTGSFMLKTETLKESIGAGCCDVD